MRGGKRGLLALGVLLALGGITVVVVSQVTGSGWSDGGIDGIVGGLLVALGIVVAQRARG